VTAIDWDALPRLLSEQCDGHPGYSTAVYRLDHPGGGRSWLCQHCYIRALRITAPQPDSKP
jgi:hypothetical protein